MQTQIWFLRLRGEKDSYPQPGLTLPRLFKVNVRLQLDFRQF
jgi:hypothetical protein